MFNHMEQNVIIGMLSSYSLEDNRYKVNINLLRNLNIGMPVHQKKTPVKEKLNKLLNMCCFLVQPV